MPSLLTQHEERVAGLGYGAKRRWQAAHLLEGFQLWRTDVFLHQLTPRGNLLLADNANQLWRDVLSGWLGLPTGIGWSRQRALLERLPRSLVRTACWRTSYEWYRATLSYEGILLDAAYEQGVDLCVYTSEWYEDYLALVEHAGRRLVELAWCYTPDVVDLASTETDDG